MKKILLSFLLMITTAVSYGQIGYQVSLLNTATGEPRANETVSCNVTLTNSVGGVVYSGTQSATSNDFGVVSLNVGNATMFENMDWSKLPLFIEVSVDGKLIGKSQVLSVPVAEYAKKTGTLTYENIGMKKVLAYTRRGSDIIYSNTWTFNGHQVKYERRWEGPESSSGYVYTGTCIIDGNTVFGIVSGRSGDSYSRDIPFVGHYSGESDTIYVMQFYD